MAAIDQENMPEMLETLILPIWQRELERIRDLDNPTAEEIKLSVLLANSIMHGYSLYRALKAELKNEARMYAPKQLVDMVNNSIAKHSAPQELRERSSKNSNN